LDAIPTVSLFIALVVVLALSAFFSLSETCLMASNKFRLRAAAAAGDSGAKRTVDLLKDTDRLLSVILLGNTVFNSTAAMLTALICERLFGKGETVLAIGTGLASFAILLFAEISPKVIGANFPNQLAPWSALILKPLVWALRPVVWFTNLFIKAFFRLLRVPLVGEGAQALTAEDLRAMVLEGRHILPAKHSAMLANVFELQEAVVDDVLTPRRAIESIDFDSDDETLHQQIVTAHHSRLAVIDHDTDEPIGVLPVRQALAIWNEGTLNRDDLRAVFRKPYFVPSGTPLLVQLQRFQETHERMAFVVNEYGDTIGMVTVEDIVEEVVGEFTSSDPANTGRWTKEENGGVVVPGSASVRTLNRRLGTNFAVDGPKTLNGVLLEVLGEIPSAGVSMKLGEAMVEVRQVQDRSIRSVWLKRLDVNAKSATN
jgi:Mg2+/Co2+ transporter CorB